MRRTWCRGRGRFGCVLLFLFLAFIKISSGPPTGPRPPYLCTHLGAGATGVVRPPAPRIRLDSVLSALSTTPSSSRGPLRAAARDRDPELLGTLPRGTCHVTGAPWHWVERGLKPEARKSAKPGGAWASELSTRGGWGVPSWEVPCRCWAPPEIRHERPAVPAWGRAGRFSPALRRCATHVHVHIWSRDTTALTMRLADVHEASPARATAVCLQTAVAALGSTAEWRG